MFLGLSVFFLSVFTSFQASPAFWNKLELTLDSFDLYYVIYISIYKRAGLKIIREYFSDSWAWTQDG